MTGYEVFRCGGESCTDLSQIGQIADVNQLRGQDRCRWQQLQLPGARGRRGRQHRPVLQQRQGDDARRARHGSALCARNAVGDGDEFGEVDLGWGAATDDSAVLYDLERCAGSGCTDFAPLATTATTDYSDTSVAAGSTYVYRVRAVDAAGNIGPYSNTASATTSPTPSGGPGPFLSRHRDVISLIRTAFLS